MTVSEAARIALEELNIPEERIKERVQFAAECAPLAAHAIVPEGMEREFIEMLKQVQKMVDSDPKLQGFINQNTARMLLDKFKEGVWN